MSDIQNPLNQEEPILNENQTQQDAGSDNEVNVVPHKEINPEDNQLYAKLDKQNVETPKVKDQTDTAPTQIDKNLQVDQEGNVISAGSELQEQQEEKKKEEPVLKKEIQIKKDASGRPILAGDSFLVAGNVFQDIYRKAQGLPVGPETERGIFEKTVTGIVDFNFKTAMVGFSLAKEINNAASKDGLIIPKEKIADIEKWYKDTLLGKIGTEVEEEAKKSAISKLTSEFLQYYTFAKTGASLALSGAQKVKMLIAGEEGIAAAAQAEKLTADYIKAVKDNKIVIPNEKIVQAYEKAAQLNQLSRGQKFGIAIVGGAAGGALIADFQDVGTMVLDLLGYGMDTDTKEDSQEDSIRILQNRFKFFLDNVFVTVPIAYGLGKMGQLISKYGKDLAFSDSKLDRLIDYVASGFRSRGVKSQDLFELGVKAEGQINVAKNTARDLIIDINKTLSKISESSGIAKGSPAWEEIMERLNKFLIPEDNKVVGGKIVFHGFDNAEWKAFENFAEEAKLNPDDINALKGHLVTARENFNTFINTMLSNGNILVNAKEFNKIMAERIQNMFTSDYRIFTEKNSIIPMLNYNPVSTALDETGNILAKYAADNGRILSSEEIKIQMQDILKNVRLDPITKMPTFIINNFSALEEEATQIIKIADNFQGGKFKPSKFFKSEKAMNSYLELFGQKQADIRSTIANTMSDLGILTAKDNFYNGLLKKSEELLANGERSVLYPDRLSAMNPQIGLKNQNIITGKNGLQIESPLGVKVYANPINGKFTSDVYADAINFSEKMAFDALSKMTWYRNLVLVPKSMVQMSKTIFDQFTHAKVFMANNLFILGNGNFFIDPRKTMSFFKESFNALQPQLLYRNTPKDLQLYNFLLERGVVYSSTTAQDLKGLFRDIEQGGGEFLNKFYNRFSNSMKRLTEIAHDSYMAGDDLPKIFNFLAEWYKYRNAYADLIKAGKITELEIMDKAAKIVGNTMVNYNFVGSAVRGLRRTPLGNFPAFHSDVIRTGANVIELGLQEAKDPVLRSIGIKRLLGFGIATSVAVPLVAQVVRGLYGITTDTVNAVREFVPSYSKGSQLIVMQDKDTGKYKYIDPSSGFVYDAFVGPVQSAVAGIDSDRTFDENATTMQGIRKGLAEYLIKAKNPYIDESIWFGTLNDIFIRKGVTREGYRIWNPQAPLGDKIVKGVEYVFDKVAPFGYDRDKRIYHALTNTPGPRGEKYNFWDEAGVAVGARAIEVDPIKDMPFILSEYKRKFNDSRGLFTGETLNKVPSTNDIVQNWIKANAAAYDLGNEIYKKKLAANMLGVSNAQLYKEFEARQQDGLYRSLQANKFNPIPITESQKKEFRKEYKDITTNFEDLEYVAPYNPTAARMINQLKNIMKRMPYGQKFEDYVNPKDWLINDNNEKTPLSLDNKQSLNIPPINTPPVNPQVLSNGQQQVASNQNEFERAFPNG